MSYFVNEPFKFIDIENPKATDLNAYNFDLTAASTDYTVISKPVDGNVGLVVVSVTVPSGSLTAGIISLKDSVSGVKNVFHICDSVPIGKSQIVLNLGSLPVSLQGDLVISSDTAGVKVNVFAVKS